MEFVIEGLVGRVLKGEIGQIFLIFLTCTRGHPYTTWSEEGGGEFMK